MNKSDNTLTTDIAVIGAGIAGLSVAAALSNHLKVTVLERESQPGYHATGRSAAYFSPGYGNAVVRGLTASSAAFYQDTPAGFSPVALLHNRDALHLVPSGHQSSLDKFCAAVADVEPLDVAEALQRVPILNPDYVAGAALEKGGGDLDVDAILQGFQRALKANSGQVLTNAEVTRITLTKRGAELATANQTISAKVVVNAAGAWADNIARLAGTQPLGLVPKRRTALLVPAPSNSARWPIVINDVDPLYFRPDAGQLMLSPIDETPSEPCDAAPEELDIARAVAHFEASTLERISRITHRWAGLRTFAPDNTFVVGRDPRQPAFFWLAGQGGYGVQTAPALSNLAAAWVAELLGVTIDAGSDEQFRAALNPARFSATL